MGEGRGPGVVLRAAAVRGGVRDTAVLDAVEAVDRRRHLPDDGRPDADVDAALRLPCSQTTSQPSLVALMVEALRLTPTSRVLEIGTGYGYEAAVLARLAAEVWTVERVPQLAAQARLALADVANAHVVDGDGTAGLPEHAPYDAIVVAAQADEVPGALVEQLAVGGRLVAPVGGSGVQRCLAYVKAVDGRLRLAEDLGAVCFVPLVAD